MHEGLFCRLVTTQYGKTWWLLTGDDRLPMKKVPTGMSSKKVSGLIYFMEDNLLHAKDNSLLHAICK